MMRLHDDQMATQDAGTVTNRFQKRFFRLPSAPLIALGLGLLLTATLFTSVHRIEEARTEADFHERSEGYIATIESNFDDGLAFMADLNRLFSTFGSVSREQFHSWTRPLLNRYPHVSALSFHRLVPETERAAYEEEMRARFPGFAITELSEGKFVPAAPRPRHNVVDYLEPMQGNEKAFGIDSFYNAPLLAAFERAVDSGKAVAAPLVRLAQHANDQHSFLFIMPVYRPGAAIDDVPSRRANVIGDTAAVFHIDQMMDQAMHTAGVPNVSDFDIRLFAADRVDPSRLVYRLGSDNDTAAPKGQQLARTFFFAGQPWHVVIHKQPESFGASHHASFITLFTGILASVLTALWVHSLVSRSRRVHRLVKQRTAELQIANQRMQDDMTARQHAEQVLRLYGRAIDSSANAIAIVRANDYTYEYVNPAFTRITGYSYGETINREVGFTRAGLSGEEACRAEIAAAMKEHREGRTIMPCQHKDGTHYWVDCYISPVPDDQGEIHHHVLVMHDITRTRMYEAELEFQANSDALTALANRSLLRDRLAQAIAYANADNSGIWVVFIDLDRFKLVNDTLGYQAGDKLLVAMAGRLRSLLTHTDTAARFAGDEFTLVLSERQDRPLNTDLLQRIMDLIQQPFVLEDREIVMTCSIGVAAYPYDGAEAEVLIQHADLAMFRAKQEGRDRFRFFTAAMNEQAQQRFRLEGDLRCAIERNEFILHYQPQYDAQTENLVGAEALIRWRHPELGMVPPADFIGLAEDTGLIVPIGEWVLRTACAQNKAWQESGLGHFRIAVNLSAQQFAQHGLADTVASALQESGLDPHYLELELTESVLMTNVERAIGVLSDLKKLGVYVSVDDFGTGYSSLAYLKRFPIDMLKIDRSFVRDIATDGSDEQIVLSIISLAHNLGLQVVGEGVETKEQFSFLQRNRCDIMQGYYFAVPMPAEAFERTVPNRHHPQLQASLLP